MSFVFCYSVVLLQFSPNLCICFFVVFFYRESSEEDDEAVEAMAEIDKFEDNLKQKEIIKPE